MNRVCINKCMRGHKPDCAETETHRSCNPVEATRGLLCERCFEQLRNALNDAPAVILHLRSIYGSLSAPSSDGSQKTRREPPVPINLSAFEMSEKVYELIVGERIRLQDSPARIVSKMSQVIDTILQTFDDFVNRNSVEHVFGIVRIVRAAKSLFPIEEKIQKTAMPCPECDLRTIYTPPQAFGDSMRVSCEACGFEVPPDKIAFYAHLAEKENR